MLWAGTQCRVAATVVPYGPRFIGYSPLRTYCRLLVWQRQRGSSKHEQLRSLCSSSNGSRSGSSSSSSSDPMLVNIGGVRAAVPSRSPSHPELVPFGYLSGSSSSGGGGHTAVAEQRPPSTTTVRLLRWLTQKRQLGDDAFLIGAPGPSPRQVSPDAAFCCCRRRRPWRHDRVACCQPSCCAQPAAAPVMRLHVGVCALRKAHVTRAPTPLASAAIAVGASVGGALPARGGGPLPLGRHHGVGSQAAT
jgi:hypothetical protein|eukprot:COSAG02_NODE_17445_length_1003_cov_0.911504_1_plen_248_part_00